MPRYATKLALTMRDGSLVGADVVELVDSSSCSVDGIVRVRGKTYWLSGLREDDRTRYWFVGVERAVGQSWEDAIFNEDLEFQEKVRATEGVVAKVEEIEWRE